MEYTILKNDDKELYEKAEEIGSLALPCIPTAEELRLFTDGYEDCKSLTLGIGTDGEMVGFAHIISFENVDFLNLFAIHPNYELRGLEAKLLVHIIDESQKPIITSVDLSGKDWCWQKTFWESHGFELSPIKLSFGAVGERSIFTRGRVEMWYWSEALERVQIMWKDNDIRYKE